MRRVFFRSLTVVTTSFLAISILPVSRSGDFALAARQSATGGGSSMQEKVAAKEREGLEALKTGDIAHFGELTAEDAVFVDPHGIASKAEVMKNVAGFRLTDFTIEDLKFLRLSDKAGLISYKVTETGVTHGKEFTAIVFVSSIWAERGGKWLCEFSQETAARMPPAAPVAPPSPN
jgi:Domain of unknown function (DUF4440)